MRRVFRSALIRSAVLAACAAASLGITLTPTQAFGMPLVLFWLCLGSDSPQSECGINYVPQEDNGKVGVQQPATNQSEGASTNSSDHSSDALQQQVGVNSVEGGSNNAQGITQSQSVTIENGRQPK